MSEESDRVPWDQYVGDHPQGSPFLSFAWRDIVLAAYGMRAYYLAARSSDEIVGVLPLIRSKGLFGGHVLATCPFSTAGSVCADDPQVARALLEHGRDLAVRLGSQFVELKGTSPHPHEGVVEGRVPYANYTLRLEEEDVVWSAFKGSARTAVRKARKAGLSLSWGRDQFADFYRLMTVSMKRLGSPVHSPRFYRGILDQMPGKSDIVVARQAGQPVAAYLLLWDRRAMYHLSGGSDARHWKLNGNSLLTWASIQRAIGEGLEAFDFGRSRDEAGTARFKEQWSPQKRPLHYEYFLVKAKQPPAVDPTNPRYRLAIAAWRRLPLWVTRQLGPLLIRGIP